MKTIDTLLKDIDEVRTSLEKGLDTDGEALGAELATLLRQRLNPDRTSTESPPRKGGLRFSNVGTPCSRKLWYSVNKQEHAEPLQPNTTTKFLYGDILELLLLEYARKAGHTVEGTQTELEYDGIKGHRDAVIDGVLVDVKSASPLSFQKFKRGLTPEGDSFGYLGQLGSYLAASRDDSLVTEKNKAAFLVIEKVTGDICLDVHEYPEERLEGIRELISSRKALVNGEEVPERTFPLTANKEIGTEVLPFQCAYCEFKAHCWGDLKVQFTKRGKPLFVPTEVDGQRRF